MKPFAPAFDVSPGLRTVLASVFVLLAGCTTTNGSSSGNTSSGTTSGNTSSGNTSSGNTSSGNTSSGNTSSGNTSSGNTSSGGTVDAGPVEPSWVAPVLPPTSAGCGGNATGTSLAGVMKATPAGRSYRIVVPTNYNANKAYPVVFLFHGWQTNGTDFKSWFEFEKYGAPNGQAIIVYPDAINGLWDLSGPSDLTFFDDMSAQIQATYCTNPQRTFALGFSFGGKFINHLACHRAGYVRAASIGDGSGGDRGQDGSCGRLPMLITHRPPDQDELYAWGKENSEYWAGKNGCSVNQADVLDAQYKCKEFQGCTDPGKVLFCTDDEDKSKIPGYETYWDHTVTERFRALTWTWFDTFK